MNKPKYEVGERVRVEAGEGAVTEFVADRKCYRIRLDDGRVQTVDEQDVKAGKKKDEGAAHKMVEGPARERGGA